MTCTDADLLKRARIALSSLRRQRGELQALRAAIDTEILDTQEDIRETESLIRVLADEAVN
jgi:hypothetical protein